MGLERAVGVAHKDQGPAVGDLQRALLKLGYYGIRFAIDGDYGRNTLGAVLACKYDLAAVYGMKRRDRTYAPRAGTPGSLSASGEVTAVFVEAIQTLLAGKPLGGIASWRTPTRAQVADAGIDVREFLLAEARTTPFPGQLLWTIVGVESGASHFDHLGNVKFGIDWRGRNYSETVYFSPEGASEPWVRSRGWGLTQYTPPYRAGKRIFRGTEDPDCRHADRRGEVHGAGVVCYEDADARDQRDGLPKRHLP